MLKHVFFSCILSLYFASVLAQEEYPIPEDAQVHEGVPQGRVDGPFVCTSKIYPGTIRNYWIYVPASYDAARQTPFMVVQDGANLPKSWRLPVVLDNLIFKKDVPSMIGIFIDHGTVPAAAPDAQPRFNRSFEYDALGDRYARFLIEELLPEVRKSYNLTLDPDGSSIAGHSSGAICAFNVAWERPDAFRRVLSSIGTYVGIRGADEFPTLIRKTEPKPLRIFLQDGTGDLNIHAGDWWTANVAMLSALAYSGYEVNHIWGDGSGHNSKHTASILPEALKWLWKDYPAPVRAHQASSRQNIVAHLNDWQEIAGVSNVSRLAASATGEMYFYNPAAKGIYKIDSVGRLSEFYRSKEAFQCMMFGRSGNLFAFQPSGKAIVSISAQGVVKTILKDVRCSDLLVTVDHLYFTETQKNRIGIYSFKDRKVTFTYELKAPTVLSLSAEQTFMNVASLDSRFGYSFKVEADGSLAYAQPYIHFHIPYGQSNALCGGMTVDSQNMLYSTTCLGIQLSDPLGRINFIFSKPGNAELTDLKFGGKEFNWLYVICGGKIFKRKIHAHGVLPWNPPVKTAKPGL